MTEENDSEGGGGVKLCGAPRIRGAEDGVFLVGCSSERRVSNEVCPDCGGRVRLTRELMAQLKAQAEG